MTVREAIEAVRDSTCALLRVRKGEERTTDEGDTQIEFALNFLGSAFCIVDNRRLLTAYHTLNGGEEPLPNDRFFAVSVPANQMNAYHAPVVGVTATNPELDLAILELGEPHNDAFTLSGGTLAQGTIDDGTRVVTYGFPAPVIQEARVAPDGTFQGGRFFLKGHANEGIVSAQYGDDDRQFFEFNVGWHHGESGGPVVHEENQAALALMQHYRDIKSPHGVVAGPHRGVAIASWARELEELGATFV